MIRFALAIPHAPHIPGRSKSLGRLRDALFGPDALWRAQQVVGSYEIFADREPNHRWSDRMWLWGEVTGDDSLHHTAEPITHFLTLQDDVIPAHDFWVRIAHMVESMHDQIIALETVHDAAPLLALDGHRWCSTSDGLVGIGYVLPLPVLREFNAWRQRPTGGGRLIAPTWRYAVKMPKLGEAGEPTPYEHTLLTEDTLINLFALSTGRRIFHPIPTIIDHDTTLPSSYADYGNDTHGHRRPSVRIESNPTAWLEAWDRNEIIPHLGNFYGRAMVDLAEKAVAGFAGADKRRALLDDGARVLEPLRIRDIARHWVPAKWKLWIHTPTRGAPHPEYMASILALQRAIVCDVRHEWTVAAALTVAQDLVRVRSRAVRMMLETDATHMLCVDDDIAFDPRAILGMLHTEKDVVCAPYPRRDDMGYSLRVSDKVRAQGGFAEDDLQPDGTVEIEGTGLGCALISRACLERMIIHYHHDLRFDDAEGQERTETVALFQLMFCEHSSGKARLLLSEDQSFFERWRLIGGKTWLYVGPHAPVRHFGMKEIPGKIEDLGLSHVAPAADPESKREHASNGAVAT